MNDSPLEPLKEPALPAPGVACKTRVDFCQNYKRINLFHNLLGLQ
jgi:hypothetical protein